MRMIIICILNILCYIINMDLDYYKLPFGAQLLLWTSRIVINASCRNFPNKYDLVDKAYKKVGLSRGLILLKDLLYYLRNKKDFKLQSICTRSLILNEINFINCIEENKYPHFNNEFYIKLWSINNDISGFCNAAKELSIAFKDINLNTNIKPIKNDKVVPKTDYFKNITLH